jgi:hypothetical protein
MKRTNFARWRVSRTLRLRRPLSGVAAGRRASTIVYTYILLFQGEKRAIGPEIPQRLGGKGTLIAGDGR